jgi:hypothetical protein
VSRLDRDAIIASLTERLGAAPDPSGVGDLTAKQGVIAVAASPAEIGPAFGRVKPVDGYRWVAINTSDLFHANPLSLGSKVGIMDPTGRVLKAADLPRKR